MYTFNSTELRAINVAMQLVQPLGPLNVVATEARPQRGAPRGAAQRALENVRNILFTAHHCHALPPSTQLWEIPAGEETRILMHCV